MTKEYYSLDKILSCDVQYFIFIERRSGVKLYGSKILHKAESENKHEIRN